MALRIPFLFGPRPPLRPGEKVQTATCSVVEHQGHRYLLSAAHVLPEALRAVEGDPRTDVVVGPLRLELKRSTIRCVDPRHVDVATVALTESQLAEIERAGHRIIGPLDWPPPTVQPNDHILMAGYPGKWRLQVGPAEHDFRATTQGLTVESVHPREFIARRNPVFGNPISVSLEDVPTLGVGGCSGGPVFLVREEAVVVPRLCGIVSEGAEFGTEDSASPSAWWRSAPGTK